jgi:hypothetical protein
MTTQIIMFIAATLSATTAFASDHHTTKLTTKNSLQNNIASTRTRPATQALQAKRMGGTFRPHTQNKPFRPPQFHTIDAELLPTALVEQTLSLESGWTIVSFNVLPLNTDAETLFADIAADMMLVKDNNGAFYSPEFNYNGLGEIEFGQGYFVNLKTETELTIRGRAVNPDQIVSVEPGWNTIGTTLDSDLDASCIDQYLAQFDPNYTDLLLVDSQGLEFDSSTQINDIGDLVPGLGYQLHLDTSTTIDFRWADVEDSCSP